MATYTIIEATDDWLYCQVEENGSSFGQIVYGPASRTRASIESVIEQALSRSGPVEREQVVVEAIQTKARMMLLKDEPKEVERGELSA